MKINKFEKFLKKRRNTLLNCRNLSKDQITQLIISNKEGNKGLHEILYDYPNAIELQDFHFLIIIKILLSEEKPDSHLVDRMLRSCIMRIKDIGLFSELFKSRIDESIYSTLLINRIIYRLNYFYRKKRIKFSDLY